MKIEAQVTNQDCNHGVCPRTQGVFTCTINGTVAAWYSPSSDINPFATVTSTGLVRYFSNTGFIATLVSNNTGLTTNLSFTATTDKNGTQVRCSDLIDRNSNSMICTIIISGMSLTVLYN